MINTPRHPTVTYGPILGHIFVVEKTAKSYKHNTKKLQGKEENQAGKRHEQCAEVQQVEQIRRNIAPINDMPRIQIIAAMSHDRSSIVPRVHLNSFHFIFS